jgi:hypothetical protein
VWPGLYTSRIGAPGKDYPPQEIVEQIAVTRTRERAGGHLHFSMAPLMENRKGISDQLRSTSYLTPALVPATPWLGGAQPEAPAVGAKRKGNAVHLTLAAGKANALYAIWSRHGGDWRFDVAPAARVDWVVADDARLGAADAVFVSAIDRLGNESARVKVV